MSLIRGAAESSKQAYAENILANQDYTRILKGEVKNPRFVNKVAPKTAIKCLKAIRERQLGWGHTLKQWSSSAVAYTLPPLAVTGLMYVNREALLGAAMYYGKSLATLETGKNTLAVFGADSMVEKSLGVRPMALVAHYATHLFSSAVTKMSDAASNSVFNYYNRQAQEVERLDGEDRKQIAASFKQRFDAIGEMVKYEFSSAKTLQEKCTVESQVKAFKEKLPEIRRVIASFELTPTQIEEVLQELNRAFSQIGVSLEVDMRDKPEAIQQNYELLVKLDPKIGRDHCVPKIISDQVKEAGTLGRGLCARVKAYTSMMAQSVVTGIGVSAASTVAFKAAELANYVPAFDRLVESQLSPIPVLIAVGTVGGTAALYVKLRADGEEQTTAREEVSKILMDSQKSLKQVFDGVASMISQEDIEEVQKRIPLWRQQIMAKCPGLNADEILKTVVKTVNSNVMLNYNAA